MEYGILSKQKPEESGIILLVSDKINLKPKKVTKTKVNDKVVNTLRRYNSCIFIIFIYVPTTGAPNYINQNLTRN